MTTAQRQSKGHAMQQYERLTVVPALPCSRWLPQGGEAVFAALAGATIIKIGGVSDDVDIEGGGLVIDYLPATSPQARRVVFAFNENGMWVTFDGSLSEEVVPSAMKAVS